MIPLRTAPALSVTLLLLALLLLTALLRPVSGLRADFDNNGVVDFYDFFLFADYFGQTTDETNRKFDLTDDGRIDLDDFFVFVDNFGAVGEAPVAVTEVLLSPADTARVELPSGAFLQFQASSLLETATVDVKVYEQGTEFEVPAGAIRVSSVYEIELSGSTADAVLVTLPYDDAGMSAEVEDNLMVGKRATSDGSCCLATSTLRPI